MNTGKSNLKDLGQLVSINGKKYTSCWKRPCSSLKGTDGMIFNQAAGRSNSIDIFIPEIKRSVTFDNTHRESKGAKILTNEFVLSENTFKSGIKYEPNKCFYRKNDDLNNYDGILKSSELLHCNSSQLSPKVYSSPHFLDADSYFIESFEGLSPQKSKHSSNILLTKRDGSLVKFDKRIQVNFDTKEMSSARKMNRYIFPLFWIHETTINKALISK